MPWLRPVERLLRPLTQTVFRLTRGLTLGVRGVVVDAAGRVLLIEHTYSAGWRLPGGGVERGETAIQALERELVEEAGVRLTGPARLVSIHSQHAQFKGDHVLIYVVDAWAPCPAKPGLEIARTDWFDPGALPEATPATTRRRLAEALGGAPPDPHW
jgi:8-oxo-dGTP pyrophosphatase MutT (NUDIX family)